MTKIPTGYENNPFNIGLTGLKLLFANAKNVAIYAIVISAIVAIANFIPSVMDTANQFTMNEDERVAQQKADEKAFAEFFASDPQDLLIAGAIGATVVFMFITISLLIYGVLEYTSAKLAAGKTAELKPAFKETGKELSSYVWLYVLLTVKILLWTLLFIIPGIVMTIRYSLAGTVFFAEGKRGNAAIKRSLELTEDAWFTTFGATTFWNIITLGMAPYLIQPGINAVLYKQYADTPNKPSAHWLSYATLLVPIVLFVLFILAVAAIGLVIYSVSN